MAKKAKKKPRNYAATDTTLINLRAMKKRIVELEKSVSQLQRQMAVLRAGW
jgi:Tfp pilus assembly protein PilO